MSAPPPPPPRPPPPPPPPPRFVPASVPPQPKHPPSTTSNSALNGHAPAAARLPSRAAATAATPKAPPQDGRSESHHRFANAPTPATSNVSGARTTTMSSPVVPLDAAAQLIRHLDETFMTMSSTMDSSDADTARLNAHNAALVARRYQTRNYGYGQKRAKSAGSSSSTNGIAPPPPPRRPSPRSVSAPTTTAPPSDDADAVGGGGGSNSHRTIAASHAEDVMALSLELEQTKQALATVRSTSQSAKDEYASTVAKLEEKVEQAEEDANTALQLARESADSREALESYLKRALSELESTRDRVELLEEENSSLLQITQHGTNNDEALVSHHPQYHQLDTVPEGEHEEEPNPFAAKSRALVAMGRDMLQRRRNQLNKRFRQHKSQATDHATAAAVYGNGHHHHGGAASDTGSVQSETSTASNRRVTQLLRDSAKRLGFLGRLRGGGGTDTSANGGVDVGDQTLSLEEEDVESLVEQYCRSAEVKMHMMRDEIKELKSLCEYLEKGMEVNNSV